MALAIVYSRAQTGIHAPLVTVEVHLSNGLPSLSIVGLPETAVKESKDRVRSALLNTHFDYPARRITINLAPADLPKEGSRFDLAIAIGILAASDQIPPRALEHHEFIGELALTGELRAIRGVVPSALQSQISSRAIVIPQDNCAEIEILEDARVLGARSLLDVAAHLNGEKEITRHRGSGAPPETTSTADFSDVHGQMHAKRALEIAAAGAHHLLMVGPPGTGKSMLACRMPGILPPLSRDEAVETAMIRSISDLGFDPRQWRVRPFRAPHHTASSVALVGGGSRPRPGEISLAHNGVLFLDELPEFDRRVLESLREPLESGRIAISRAARQAEYPASFQLVAAMNPCPCGHLGDRGGRCHCTSEQIKRYRQRISGPLMDRIDMHIEVPPLGRMPLADSSRKGCETSDQIRQRVTHAREKMLRRAGTANAALSARQLEKHCRISSADQAFLERASEQLGLSARAFVRILKVARTVADLENCADIQKNHIAEAIAYRRLDRRFAA